MGDAGGDGDGVGDGDPLASPVLAFVSFGADLDGRGEGVGEGVGEGDSFASPPVSAFFLAADLDGRGEGSGEGVGEAVRASSSVGFFFSWAVRAADELAVGRVVSSGSLTSDAVVSSSFSSVSRFMAGWLAVGLLRRFRLRV